MVVDAEILVLMADRRQATTIESWKSLYADVTANFSIAGEDKGAIPDMDLMHLLCNSKVPFYMIRQIVEIGITTVRGFVTYRSTADTFQTAMESLFTEYFDTANADVKISRIEIAKKMAMIGRMCGARDEQHGRTKMHDEQIAKVQLGISDQEHVKVQDPIKEAGIERVKKQLDQLDLNAPDFLHEYLWDVAESYKVRARHEHLVLDCLRTQDEGIQVEYKKIKTDAGYDAYRKGSILPRPPQDKEEILRRIRAYWFLYDMIDECTWTDVGRPWMRMIHQFIRDWSPSLASIVALDQYTRLAMIELHRTERSTYAKIADAAKAIMNDARWHRFESIAFLKFQSHDATKIVNFRNMTMSIPTTDSLIPAMMRPNGGNIRPGKLSEMGDLPMSRSELQSLISKAENKGWKAGKGGGGKQRLKDWYTQSDAAPPGDGKGNGKDWKGKGKGKGRKGKKWGGGGDWTPPPPNRQKDQKRGNPPGGDGAGALKVSRRVPPGEFKRILEAAAKTPDQLFCYQYNATAGCTKPDCGGPDRLHRCAECGAEHGMIANH